MTAKFVDAPRGVCQGTSLPHQDVHHQVRASYGGGLIPPVPPVAVPHAVMALPAEECRVRLVRRFTAALLARWGVDGDDQDRVLLIVGELAANAARHGRADMAVLLSLVVPDLYIEVADSGEGVDSPAACRIVAECEHGRGLGIVEVLSDWCDLHKDPSGWQTRACLRVTSSPPPGAGSA